MQAELEGQHVNPADLFETAMRVVLESTVEADGEIYESSTEFIRVTDD